MTARTKILMLVQLLYVHFSYAQSSMVKRHLRIGDTLPEIPINSIKNYKTTRANTREFRGKLLILDFWFGTCKGCLEAFPRLESLQEKFKDSLQIVMVNFESQSRVDSVFEKLKRVSSVYREPKLPSITSDHIFHELFLFQQYPHEVWIDSNGVVKAFTSASDITEENIRSMIRKGTAKMDLKMDDLSFEPDKPLLPQLCSDKNRIYYYSCILPYSPGLFGGTVREFRDSLSKTVRLSRMNMTILQLIGNAITGGAILSPYESAEFDFGKRVILNVKDSARYFFKQFNALTLGEWKKKNCYTYESVFPLKKEPLVFNYMLQDLTRYFDIKCKIEKRKMSCLALTRTTDVDKIRSKEKPRSLFDPRRDSSKIELFSSMTKWFMNLLAKENKNLPYAFVDNTGYNGRIDIIIDKAIVHDIPALREELRNRYDLDLVETVQWVNVLVITEEEQIGD